MNTYKKPLNEIILGDCLEVLKTLPDNFVDSIVTDPPYELGFMGKSWDASGIAYNKDMWKECLRVLKPGGHLLSFGGTRTYHRMAVAIEDAGFEIRDMIEWIYGSGFPKSLNIGKAVDKIQGGTRKVVGQDQSGSNRNCMAGDFTGGKYDLTKGTSEWEGWGTALKPAHEPICMARKPLAEKSVAENCLKYGTGGINIDESRVGTEIMQKTTSNGEVLSENRAMTGANYKRIPNGEAIGRFPANLIHDNSEEVRECFPETTTNGVKTPFVGGASKKINLGGGNVKPYETNSGNASRFFKSIIYTAKASKSERNKGCEGLEEKEIKHGLHSTSYIGDKEYETHTIGSNNHPTVKPLALMEYLIKMVTPKGGIVLDPFIGSGSTLVAAKQNGFNYIGIEKEEEYVKIAEARLKAVTIQETLL